MEKKGEEEGGFTADMGCIHGHAEKRDCYMHFGCLLFFLLF